MSEESKEEIFEVEEVDLLRIQFASEKVQRLQYTIKELYEDLIKAQDKVKKAKAEFENKYTEEGKYKLLSIDEEKFVGKRVAVDQENSNKVEETDEVEIVVEEQESDKDE